MKFETLAIHAGQEPEEKTGAIIVPIYQTSTYVQTAVGEHKGYEYSRTQNPTREALEICLAALEGGKYALAFSSGMAATSTVMALFEQGDHLISGDDVYGGTYRVFEKIFRPWGLDYTFVDTTDLDQVAKAITPKTRMLWLETPSNPLLKVTDLRAAAALARKHKILLAVDNTFASPYFQQPLALGADIVVHSSTKFLGGHSDVIGGATVTSDDKIQERLAFARNAIGPVPGPFDVWIILRGIKTLGIRMRQHEANAMAIAEFLSNHPRVRKVLYPGLPTDQYHERARNQMTGFGSLVSFYIKGGETEAKAICGATKVFALAESLGGVESLIEHPALMTHATIPREIREPRGLGDDLIRLSVGIEHIDDLLADIEAALGSY
ncbi:MAG TPA: cystathionine gamma-synthase [Acidobacteriota bacterium]|nr:cystathionine gamma-synthase [Acidobacteriota bacterium]